MFKSQVNILNFKTLYNILFEIKDFLKFEVINYDAKEELLKQYKENKIQKNSIVLSKENINDSNLNIKNLVILKDFPINIMTLIDQVNISLLKEKYNSQANFNVKNYKVDLNSRVISNQKNNLKLTEREIEIILYLANQKYPQKIEILQKEVWGYSENLETHTVETHVYRLRKKINEKFNDDKFLKSTKDGYLI